MLMRACVMMLAATGLMAADLPKDVFQRDELLGSRPGTQRLITDVQLGKPQAERRLERWLKSHPEAPADDRLTGFQILCGTYFREQRFDEGMRACSQAEQVKKGSAGNMVDLLRSFRTVGPLHWSSTSVRIPLVNGQATTASRGPASVEALIDSGAELGVITESVARRLGARPIKGSVSLATTTTSVAGNFVVVDGLRIGDATLHNLTAVVLTDEQAKYSGLQLIIPLPALIALGRFAYVDHGRALLLGQAAPPLSKYQTRAYWDESGIGFAVTLDRGIRGAHFDSGSRRTWLFPAALSAVSAPELASRTSFERKIGGVGGERIEQASKLHNFKLEVAGRPWRFEEIEVAEKDENGEAARIGTGLLTRFKTVTFDTRRMIMSVER